MFDQPLPACLTLDAADLQQASRQFFAISAGYFDRFAVLSAAGAQVLTLDEAGLALTAALLNGDDVPTGTALARSLSLRSVRLVQVQLGAEVDVPLAGLAEHPLLSRWVPLHFGRAVGDVMRTGVLWTQIAPDAPGYGDLEIYDSGEGVVSARLRLSWEQTRAGAVVAIADYGGDCEDARAGRSLTVEVSTVAAIALACPLDRAPGADTGATPFISVQASSAEAGTVH
jgi:hypothetical protein